MGSVGSRQIDGRRQVALYWIWCALALPQLSSRKMSSVVEWCACCFPHRDCVFLLNCLLFVCRHCANLGCCLFMRSSSVLLQFIWYTRCFSFSVVSVHGKIWRMYVCLHVLRGFCAGVDYIVGMYVRRGE